MLSTKWISGLFIIVLVMVVCYLMAPICYYYLNPPPSSHSHSSCTCGEDTSTEIILGIGTSTNTNTSTEKKLTRRKDFMASDWINSAGTSGILSADRQATTGSSVVQVRTNGQVMYGLGMLPNQTQFSLTGYNSTSSSSSTTLFESSASGPCTFPNDLKVNGNLLHQSSTLQFPAASGTLARLEDLTSLPGTHPAVTVTAVGSVPNANAATINTANQILQLQPASEVYPGVVTIGAQSFGGYKWINGEIYSSLEDDIEASKTLSSSGARPLTCVYNIIERVQTCASTGSVRLPSISREGQLCYIRNLLNMNVRVYVPSSHSVIDESGCSSSYDTLTCHDGKLYVAASGNRWIVFLDI